MLSKNIKRLANSTEVLLRHENYIYKILTPQNKQQSLDILTTAFSEEQPLAEAYHRSFPHERPQKQKIWRSFWGIFSEDSMNNGISVGCFDADKNEELVGVSVAKDLQYVPNGFQDLFMKGKRNFISPIIKLQEYLLSKTDPEIQPILGQKGVVMDIWGVAIKKEHFGKRILGRMMEANINLGRQAGYQYAFCYATNFKTGKSLARHDFTKIAEANVRNFEVDGVRPFKLIDPDQEKPSIWLRKFDGQAVL